MQLTAAILRAQQLGQKARRLNKKGNRMLIAGKHLNKVKVACAREMVGFVWESLNKVAA